MQPRAASAPGDEKRVDRWHLIANLGDAVEDFLIRAHIRLEDGKASLQKEQVEEKPLSSFSATPSSQRKSQAHLLRKWKLYQRVQELHATGMSLRKIGEELGLSRNTVRKYAPPKHQSRRVLHHVRCVKVGLIRMKTTCFNDGVRGSAMLLNFTAKSVNVDIRGVHRWCEPM
jgi:hypothetical protein